MHEERVGDKHRAIGIVSNLELEEEVFVRRVEQLEAVGVSLQLERDQVLHMLQAFIHHENSLLRHRIYFRQQLHASLLIPAWALVLFYWRIALVDAVPVRVQNSF